MGQRKYTKEVLEPLVAGSVSVAEVIRKMGHEKWSGGLQNLLTDRIREYGLDTSHFTGQRTNKGQAHRGGPDKLHWSAVLVKCRVGMREKVSRLRRAMFEAGIPHVCHECGLGPKWEGKPLVLAIEHRNGDRTDNRIENVVFLCPNCHSQTETFGRRNAR